MNNFLTHSHFYLLLQLNGKAFWEFCLMLFPIVLLIEIPFYTLLIIAIFRYYFEAAFLRKKILFEHPDVSCIVAAYNEGQSITQMIKSLYYQLYPGNIEILVIVDGADINVETYEAAKNYADSLAFKHNRTVNIIPRNVRGGHASSLNLGIKLAKADITVILDGDCSCDNNAILASVKSMTDPNVVGSAGTLRVRNARQSFLTCLQTLEYIIGIHLSRVGLGMLNTLNVVSGAFGVYRKSFLEKIGGWKNGSAEDLDLTIRIEAYLKRNPGQKLAHNPDAIAFTDVPTSLWGLMKQRLRWDGDLYYIYCKRHWRILRPKFLGWKSFFVLMWYGFLITLVLPFVMVFSLIYSFIKYKLAFMVSLLSLVYGYYFLVTLALFFLYLILTSERKLYDLSFIIFLPFTPIFQLFLRIWAVIAFVIEMTIKSHRDSTMAPSWVNKRVD